MMNLRIPGTALTLMLLMMGDCRAFAKGSGAIRTVSKAIEAMPVAPKSEPASSLVPADFNVPILVETSGFKIVPLGPELVKIDFEAYMSSIEHLQKTFTRSTDWPHKDISDADAMKDMEAEQVRFKNRKSFAYAVLTPDGIRERGSVYVYPSSVPGYDAVVRFWVTKAEYDAGFDAELYRWVIKWIQTRWPFAKVAYPGRAIAWDSWDSLVKANAVGKAVP